MAKSLKERVADMVVMNLAREVFKGGVKKIKPLLVDLLDDAKKNKNSKRRDSQED